MPCMLRKPKYALAEIYLFALWELENQGLEPKRQALVVGACLGPGESEETS
jgi:hypothetical protein